MNTQLRTVSYGGGKIEYYLTRKRVKNINLRIRSSDGTVQVSAAPRVSVAFVDKFVLANAEFILSALKRYHNERAKSEHFAENGLNDGDEVIILGRRLKVSLERAEKESVEIKDDYVIISLMDKNDYIHRRKLFEKYLDELRESVFNAAVDKIYPIFQRLGMDKPQIIIKNSVSRWGYCQPQKGIVMLNKQLICVSEPLIEYLVLHEFTHLLYPDHSPYFWGFMQRLMPDCRQRRRALGQYSFLLKKN